MNNTAGDFTLNAARLDEFQFNGPNLPPACRLDELTSRTSYTNVKYKTLIICFMERIKCDFRHYLGNTQANGQGEGGGTGQCHIVHTQKIFISGVFRANMGLGAWLVAAHMCGTTFIMQRIQIIKFNNSNDCSLLFEHSHIHPLCVYSIHKSSSGLLNGFRVCIG